MNGGRRPQSWPRPLVSWLPAAKWPAVAALVAGLLIWNVALQWRVAYPPYGPDVEALSRRPGRMVIFAGTGAPGARARACLLPWTGGTGISRSVASVPCPEHAPTSYGSSQPTRPH